MNNQDYEQKKRECWEEFKNAAFNGNTSYSTCSALDFAFDRAYALGKQEKDAEGTVISGWLCRDKVINEPFTSDLFLAFDEPTRIEEWGKWGDMGDYIELDSSLFPDLTWDSEPIEVELRIKRKDE